MKKQVYNNNKMQVERTGTKRKLLFPPEIKFRTVAFKANEEVAAKLDALSKKHRTSVMAVASTIFQDVIDLYE